MASFIISNIPSHVSYLKFTTQTKSHLCKNSAPFRRVPRMFGFQTEFSKLLNSKTKHCINPVDVCVLAEHGKSAHLMASTPFSPVGPEILRDRFIDFTEEDALMMEKYKREIESAQEEVRIMLMDKSMDQQMKLSFVDILVRLGVSYYYQTQVSELLDRAFEEFEANNFSLDYDLCTIAAQFLMFRQHGYKMLCDVFKKFTTSEGRFKEELKSDINGMLSLYQAAHLRKNGEDILDEALAFSTRFLRTIMESSEQVRYSLNQPLHYSITMVATRRYISSYENDESRNETVLRLAKLNFNWLQLLYRQELSQIQKWWRTMDIENKFAYVRDIGVECHFWAMATYYEPEYSLGRIFLAKVIYIIFLIDDTYDTHATYQEIELLTNIFERWDVTATKELPVAYMKPFVEFIIDTFDEFSDEMITRGKPYVARFAKDRLINYIRGQCVEAKWSHEKIRPTFREFMINAKMTTAVDLTVISSCMGEKTEADSYERLLQAHKAIGAAEIILRLKNDIISHKDEQVRGRIASVDCYMKDFDKSKEEVVNLFNKMIVDAWKDLNEELLVKMNAANVDGIPRPILERILNCARQAHTLYSVVDKSTSSRLKNDIISAYTRSFTFQ